MAELNEVPKANRIHIAFFGLRNAGKSTLVNAFTGQNIAIVSDVAGTTTDPVSKAMEILPLGPCLVTDTAGLDDIGELGQMRVEKTLKVLETTDIAVWVQGLRSKVQGPRSEVQGPRSKVQGLRSKVQGEAQAKSEEPERMGPDLAQTKSEEPEANEDVVRAEFVRRCSALHISFLEFYRGDSVDDLKKKIAALKFTDDTPGLLDGLVRPGDRVICVCPIDESAPKGRLILPQVQVLRDCLDRHVPCTVCQPEELGEIIEGGRRTLVVTDSQAFAEVKRTLLPYTSPTPTPSPYTYTLTSFSILFARQKGDLKAFTDGLSSVSKLKDGDRVLIAEGCTHHRQCNDIGTTKIPKALAKLSGGRKLEFSFASGGDFLQPSASDPLPALVVQCGGCMLTRREMLRRIEVCRASGVPIVNYGLLLASAAGLDLALLVRGLT